MRDLDYNATLQKLFTPSIVATLTQIHEGKGILPIASVTGQDTLEKLNEIAKTRLSIRTRDHRQQLLHAAHISGHYPSAAQRSLPLRR